MRRGALALLALLALLLGLATARAAPPPERLAALRRGINVTNWFRYPPREDDVAIRAYLSDAAIADLRRAGFGFVRLPVQPEFVFGAPGRVALLVEQVRRLERAGLAVIVELHPKGWDLEARAADRAALIDSWRRLAPALAALDPRLTFAEVLNEPVFRDDAAGWERLQAEALATIRAALPRMTVVLSGNEWGDLDGLLRLHPAADPDVIYSVHFYEPMALTTPELFEGTDPRAMARMRFPAAEPCVPEDASGRTRAVIAAYCREGWDAARVAARIARAASWARANRAAVLVGEIGASRTLEPSSRLAWLAAVRRACESEGIGWALWGYDDAHGLAVPRPPGPRPALDAAVLQALGLRTP
jgi:hypothetical protein